MKTSWLAVLLVPGVALAAGEAGPGEHARRLLGEALQAQRTAGPSALPEVIARFRAAAQAAPSWNVAQLDLGAVLDRSGDSAAALTAYRAALTSPAAEDPQAREANSAVRKAAAGRACALALLLPDAALSRAVLEEAQRAAPGEAWPLELRAEVELALGDAASARQAARSALAIAPKSIAGLCALAKAQLALGTPGTARLLALRAAEFAPHDARPQLVLAALARSNGDPAGELLALQAAASADPRSAKAALLLGRALFARGRSDDALAALDRAARLDPRSAAVHLARGSLLAARNQPAAAEREVALAVKLSPRSPAPQLELARLKARTPRSEQALKGSAQAPVVQDTEGSSAEK